MRLWQGQHSDWEIRRIEAPLGRVADRLDVIDGLYPALDAALRAVPTHWLSVEAWLDGCRRLHLGHSSAPDLRGQLHGGW